MRSFRAQTRLRSSAGGVCGRGGGGGGASGEGGNLSEEYALSLGLLAVAASSSRIVVVGALGGAAFLMRQNLATSFAVIVAAVAIESARSDGAKAAARSVFRAAIGALAVVAPVLVGLAACSALRGWWEATFEYNRVYASGTLSVHVANTMRYVLLEADRAVRPLAGGGFGEAVRRLASKPEPAVRALLGFAVVALPSRSPSRPLCRGTRISTTTCRS